MKKFKIVFNLITVAFTAGLLVMITVAWYAVNKTANVTSSTGSVTDIDGIIESVTYYNFKSKVEGTTNTVFTIEDCTQFTLKQDQAKTSNDVEMKPYELVPSDTYSTEYLIRIKFKYAVNLSSFCASSYVDMFPGFPNENNPGYVTQKTNIPLSALVNFRVIPGAANISISKSAGESAEIEDEDDTFTIPKSTFSDATKRTFTLDDTDHSITTRINFNSTPIDDVTEVYIVIDYDLDRMVELYSNNLGNSAFEGEGDPTFKTSFFFIVSGSEAVSPR